MIRLRDGRGKVVEVPPGTPFVEICDQDGDVALLFIRQGERVHTVRAGDPEARRYTEAYGVRWSGVVEVMEP